MTDIDYDKPGHCARCHAEIAEFDGAKLVRFTGIARTAKFKLDNGSNMDVMLCDKCFDDLSPEHCQEIMESVIRGWSAEMNRVPWSEKKKTDYMNEYSERSIELRIDKAFVQEKLDLIKKPDLTKCQSSYISVKVKGVKNGPDLKTEHI